MPVYALKGVTLRSRPSVNRTSDLFNSGQELGGLQPLCFQGTGYRDRSRTSCRPQDGLACSRLASRRCPACGVTQKRYVHGTKSECPSRASMAEVRPKRRYARMKVLIGVDPHKTGA